MEISRRMIQRLTRSRGLLLNRRPPFLRKPVRAGDLIAVRIEATEAATLPPVAMPLVILHEDEDKLVLDKKPGMLVHPTSPKDTATLAHGLAHYFRDRGLELRIRPVHRLDRETSGLLLVAKSAFAHQHLDRQLRTGELNRDYLAIVEGSIEDETGEIDAPIGVAPRRNLRRVTPRGRPARTRYRVVRRLRGATVIAASLETGRTHQIRVHLAHIRHPLIGDLAYGGPRVSGLDRYALHAWRMRFRRPRGGGELLEFEAPFPDDLERLIRSLEG